ncbi:MAG: hypothetical protein GY708_08100 [Actinomycetia bacterium]|nr:hypothetical protein [Actinomycetes bacterium]MCP4962814.1 hypothetical protein [Actinomycetes bacterium]
MEAAAVRRVELGIAKRKNAAIADVSIGGDATYELVAASGLHHHVGAVDVPSNPVFTAGVVGRRGLADLDSEYKILEEIANRIGPASETVTGAVRLYTERPACDSCLGVLMQFSERYPNIVVAVFQGGG